MGITPGCGKLCRAGNQIVQINMGGALDVLGPYCGPADFRRNVEISLVRNCQVYEAQIRLQDYWGGGVRIMATNKTAGADTKGTEGTKLKWDDSNMKSSYANVCNVTSTREEVVMLFGMNQAWNRGQKEVTIQLTDRIIISPYAAKRLNMLLGGVVTEYEKRFGALNVDAPAGAAVSTGAVTPEKK